MKKFFTNLLSSEQNKEIKEDAYAVTIGNPNNIPQLELDIQKYIDPKYIDLNILEHITTYGTDSKEYMPKIDFKNCNDKGTQNRDNFTSDTITRPKIYSQLIDILRNTNYDDNIRFQADRNIIIDRHDEKPTTISKGQSYIRKPITPFTFKNDENKTDSLMLPPVIWLAIFLHLSGNDNRNLIGVCRLFANIITSDIRLLDKVNDESTILRIDNSKCFVMH
jgi:hypothetical protein